MPRPTAAEIAADIRRCIAEDCGPEVRPLGDDDPIPDALLYDDTILGEYLEGLAACHQPDDRETPAPGETLRLIQSLDLLVPFVPRASALRDALDTGRDLPTVNSLAAGFATGRIVPSGHRAPLVPWRRAPGLVAGFVWTFAIFGTVFGLGIALGHAFGLRRGGLGADLAVVVGAPFAIALLISIKAIAPGLLALWRSWTR